jgi:glycosyltransferase involved in cell wall biosynthesis
MKVLVVAYFFPPLGGSGVQRLLKFVKYLPDHGIEPVVLTVDPFFVRSPKDKFLLNQLPPSIHILRTPTIDMNWFFKILWGLKLGIVVNWIQEYLLIPDKEIFWTYFAKVKLKTILKKEHFDLVFVSGGPFSSFEIALHLHKKYGLPYILDFRDEWLNNPTRLTQKHSVRRNQIETTIERAVLESASAVTFMSTVMNANFLQTYNFLKNKPKTIIPNGYDESDFNNMVTSRKRKNNYMRIVFTGSFYDCTKPQVFLQELLILTRTNKIPKDKIRLEIYGKNTSSFIYAGLDANKDELSFISLFPYVPHFQSLQLQVQADILLSYIAPSLNSEGGYAGKTFEYIRSGTPILAICPPNGLAADLVRLTRTGWIIDSANPGDIRKGFLECFKKWEKGELKIDPDWEEIRKYERHVQAGQLADIMKLVMEKEN